MDLAIKVETEPAGRRVLRLIGSVDLQSRDLLLAAAAVQAASTSAVVVNLSEVTFMDSSGIGALVELSGAAHDAEVAFALQDPSPRVRRILELTGLLSTWAVEAAG